MKCNELYAEAQKQTLEKNKIMNAAKKLNESRKAELYTRLNEIVFDGLDLNPDNSRIVIGKDDVLEHTTSKLATIARDYSVLTVSIPLSSLKKPFIVTTAEDANTLKLCDFIHNFDELAGDLMTESLANRIVDLDSEKSFKLPIFEMQYLIKENTTIKKLCAEHNQYFVSFEVVSNPAKTKKSKDGLVLDFKFGFITNKLSADDLANPLNLDKDKSREDRTDPLIKSTKIAEEIIDAFKKTKTTPPNCGSHVKRECECKCHDDGVPNTAIKIIEVKDPSELPKAIRDLLGDVL